MEILLESGASWFLGEVTPGRMNGEGNHFFTDICWDASPSMPGPNLLLLDHRFRVFAAATTNVEYTLRVTDTEPGQTRTYSNPLGNPAPAITDTSAFATCP